MTQWTTSSNDALKLHLICAPEDKSLTSAKDGLESFAPSFTYPIYGEEETIYGYSDLRIELKFASGSLRQNLSIKYSEKLPASTVDDVEGKLLQFLPEDVLRDESAFNAFVLEDATTFKPFGTKIHSYTRTPLSTSNTNSVAQASGSSNEIIEFEVYHTTWNTPGFREYHRRMQLFILLYIEGGSYINEDEDAWEFVVLYEKRRRLSNPDVVTYHFVGYSSLYQFYCFPEKIRLRLSQFVILPPYQRQGHGSALYNAIYQYTLSRADVSELTVEDPAEAFEDLRDQNDLRMLLGLSKFMSEGFGQSGAVGDSSVGPIRRTTSAKAAKLKGKMGPPVDKNWAEKWRRELKIAGRQFSRLIEMLQLIHLDPLDVRSQRSYRLQVKERLYRFNYEILMQLEKPERLEKLEETFQSVVEGYGRILSTIR